MSKISDKDIKHVAKLASLDIKSSEVKKFKGQLSEIVDYISELSEVDTKDQDETARTTKLENVVRDDEISPGLNQVEALSGSDETHNGYFKVPGIFDRKDE